MEQGLWDSHAHLDDPRFAGDREEVLAAVEREMAGVINPGCDGASNAMAVELAAAHPCLYAAVGWHPENLQNLPKDYLQQLAAWAALPKVVAIGEVGLDYYWPDNAPREVQRRVFKEQIDLAVQLRLPLIIHDREAHGDMLELFQKEARGVAAVFHCFSGSVEMAKELAKRGYYFGFGGTSTYKNARKVREVLLSLPRELLLLETDSPYLAPVPYRGKRNQPLYTKLIAQNMALLLGTDYEEVAAFTRENTLRLFQKIPRP